MTSPTKLKAAMPERRYVRFLETANLKRGVPQELIDKAFERLGDSPEAIRGYMIGWASSVSLFQGMYEAAVEVGAEIGKPVMAEMLEPVYLRMMQYWVAFAEQPYILELLEREATSED
jgi:hypothetical protein